MIGMRVNAAAPPSPERAGRSVFSDAFASAVAFSIPFAVASWPVPSATLRLNCALKRSWASWSIPKVA